MKFRTGYIITAKTDNEDLKYLALDHASGYSYWASYCATIMIADVFNLILDTRRKQ